MRTATDDGSAIAGQAIGPEAGDAVGHRGPCSSARRHSRRDVEALRGNQRGAQPDQTAVWAAMGRVAIVMGTS